MTEQQHPWCLLINSVLQNQNQILTKDSFHQIWKHLLAFEAYSPMKRLVRNRTRTAGGNRRNGKQLNESWHHYTHPSQVAAVGGKWLSFTPGGATPCQSSLGLEGWNCSLTWKVWKVCIHLASWMVIFPLFASPPYFEQYIKLSVLASFGPTDNQFQLKAEVSSAELWSAVAHGGHGTLEGL